jgi:hypothetical protein
VERHPARHGPAGTWRAVNLQRGTLDCGDVFYKLGHGFKLCRRDLLFQQYFTPAQDGFDNRRELLGHRQFIFLAKPYIIVIARANNHVRLNRSPLHLPRMVSKIGTRWIRLPID